MIPRLFEKTETQFANFGICPLIDAISCTVTEERNGEFTLAMEYARNGRWSEEIVVDRIILADPYDNAEQAEPFRIVSVSYNMVGNLTVNAQHISYQLNYVICGAYAGYSRYPQTAWDQLQANAMLTSNPFTFYTDISDAEGTVYRYGPKVAVPLRTLLGGMKGSFLDNYGGEYKWERYKVSLLSSRGSDNGVRIAYGKNLTGLTYDVDLSETVTGAVAYSDGDSYVQGSLQTLTHTYGFERAVVLDASSEFSGTTPTTAQLNSYANAYLANKGTPAVSISVEFVPLWQTDEYKAYEDLEHVSLCDTVQVVYPPLNLTLKAKVVRTVYNVLADRYDTITISSVKSSLADTIYSLMEGKA